MLMRLRNFNFSVISAIIRFNRRRFGRKAALPNLSITLRKAVEEMEEFFTVETLTFQRNKKTEKTFKKTVKLKYIVIIQVKKVREKLKSSRLLLPRPNRSLI